MDRPLLRSAAGSIVIGNPVTGGGANRVLYEDGSQNLAAASNFTFASNTLTAPTITATTAFIGPQISAGSTGGVMSFTDTAGEGPLIAAGVAASNARRALKISQTWTDGTTGNIGIVGNFDMGATGTATGKLLSLQAGAAGTTEVFNVDYLGVVGATQYSALSPVSGTVIFGSTAASSGFMAIRDGGVTAVRNIGVYGWVSGSNPAGGTIDTYISRLSAGIISFSSASAGQAALSLSERTAPSAPAANGVYIYAQDNGAGKTQLMALFNSGAAQQIAIEP